MADLRINISQREPVDAALEAVRQAVTGERAVNGALGDYGVQSVIRGMPRYIERGNTVSLDLIAHSEDGVLPLGDWVLDDNSDTQAIVRGFVPYRTEFGLSRIRLL